MSFEVQRYFPHIEEFAHATIVGNASNPWEILNHIGPTIEAVLQRKNQELKPRPLDGLRLMQRTMRLEETILTVDELIEIKEPTLVEGTQVFFDTGVVLEPGAMIKGAAVIGADTEIRQGAYLRGNVLVGRRCTLGHTTEIKNSVFMNHTEAGHFAYVGDSVLGCYVNIGAGVKLANLQLRKASHKIAETFPTIKITVDGEKVDTGTAKIGAVVGDHGEIGCNAVTAPATFLESHCWVFANITAMKGFYKSKSIVR